MTSPTAEAVMVVEPESSPLRQRLAAEMATAETALVAAQETEQEAIAGAAVAQRTANEFMEKVRPLVARLGAKEQRLAPFVQAEVEAIETSLKRAKRVASNASAALRSAQRKIEELRAADQQLASIGE